MLPHKEQGRRAPSLSERDMVTWYQDLVGPKREKPCSREWPEVSVGDEGQLYP